MRDYNELGQVIDKVLAKKWGISTSAVTQLRLKRGVAPYRTHCKVRTSEDKDALVNMLGRFRDSFIGKVFNLTRERVRQIRKDYGIAKYGKKEEK